MVAKLYKHELAALARVLIPVQCILLGVSALARLLQLFESDHLVYEIVFGSSVFFLVVANLVNLVLPLVMGIVRFYRNLFTGEGYLTFTLPVTPAGHLFVKLAAAFTFAAVSLAVSLVSVGIATIGEVFGEILLAIRYLLDQLTALVGGHTTLFLLEFLVLLAAAFCCELLLFYTCICLGQLSRKNRVLAACGVYFIYYVIGQIIGTVFSVVFSLFYEQLPLDVVLAFAQKNPVLTVHLVLGILIVGSLLGAGLWFLISHTIIRKKLNLE